MASNVRSGRWVTLGLVGSRDKHLLGAGRDHSRARAVIRRASAAALQGPGLSAAKSGRLPG